MTFKPYKKNAIFNGIYICFIAFMLGIIIYNIFNGSMNQIVIGCIVVLGLFFLEYIINKLKVVFPSVFRLVISIFLFCTMYLGEIKKFYEKFWWWDLTLHFYSGFFMVLLSVFIIGVLNFKLRKSYIYNPLLVIIICLLISISVEGLWEIFEFAGDRILNTNMEKAGLQDTMTDFIMNILGSIISGFLVYFKKEIIIESLFKIVPKY